MPRRIPRRKTFSWKYRSKNILQSFCQEDRSYYSGEASSSEYFFYREWTDTLSYLKSSYTFPVDRIKDSLVFLLFRNKFLIQLTIIITLHIKLLKDYYKLKLADRTSYPQDQWVLHPSILPQQYLVQFLK